ncbi:MAG: ChrR family anti-sigma-E factor [Hyphomicrobiales bacterium]|nr:ChrR family anti-sigma-E factor [Alphaproteobacteria bacterium]
MSIEHHPTDAMLSAFASGTLDHGQHVAIATHLVACPQCRAFMHAMEHAGGAMLTGLPPSPMADNAIELIRAQLDEPEAPSSATRIPPVSTADVPGLPKFVRSYRFGNWKWVAPSLHLRPIVLPHDSDTRVFLLKAGPGTKLLQHTHTGVEMTCILSGAFSHDSGYYGPGDFDLGDESIDHEPVVEKGVQCICLVAMQGELRLNGLLGRFMQPFVRL